MYLWFYIRDIQKNQKEIIEKNSLLKSSEHLIIRAFLFDINYKVCYNNILNKKEGLCL